MTKREVIFPYRLYSIMTLDTTWMNFQTMEDFLGGEGQYAYLFCYWSQAQHLNCYYFCFPLSLQ